MARDRLGGKKTLKVGGFLDEFEKDDIKKQIDIVSLFESFGYHPEKKGKNYVLRCIFPGHEDKTPSFTIDRVEGRYHCFGCHETGDIFDVVQVVKGCDFKESLKYLKGLAGKADTKPKEKSIDLLFSDKKEEPEEVKEQPVKVSEVNLDIVCEFYHKKIYEIKKAVIYLTGNRKIDQELIARFKIGYADGSLLKISSNGQQDELKKLGILKHSQKTDKTWEAFGGYITVPIFDDTGKVVHFYGRSTDPRQIEYAHLYLTGGHKSVFNLKASRVYDIIILVECIIDALSLMTLGIENVQSLYGVGTLTKEHIRILKNNRVKTIILAFDNDQAGDTWREKHKQTLLNEGFQVKVISPAGVKDWNEYLLQKGTKEEVLKFIEEAELFKPEPEDPVEFKARKEGQKYLFIIKGLVYRLLGVKPAFISSLRVNIRSEYEERTFLDNVDLYSSRNRSGFSQSLAHLFGLEASRIEKDLLQIVEYLEAERDKALMEHQDKPVIMNEEEKQLGLKLLQDPKLFNRILEHIEILGYVGDDTNKILMYLAASSRILDDPISVIVVSESAAGKSYLIDTVKKLIPPEEVVSMTSLSDQALNYLPEEGLIHKFLVMGEAIHTEVIEHQVREMLSSHELSRLVTTKDEKTGQLMSRTVRKKVIVSAAMSTTDHRINPENMSRFFVVQSDESREQTRRIHKLQQNKYTLDRYNQKASDIPRIIKQHWCAQRLLKKTAIVNPFARVINFPDSIMRTRRDYERFLDLIASVCFLRQYQKEEQQSGSFYYIECDLEDYKTAYEIMVQTLPMTLNNFPQGAVRLYECVRKLIKKKAESEKLSAMDVSITQREIREQAEFTQRFIKRYIKILADYEILLRQGSGSRGTRNSYKLTTDEELRFIDLSMIPAPAEVEKQLNDEELF